jgi:hypothetical protein
MIEKGLSSDTVFSTKVIRYYKDSSHAEHYNIGSIECGI